MNKCPKCGAPAKHSAPDGDFKYTPESTQSLGELVKTEFINNYHNGMESVGRASLEDANKCAMNNERIVVRRETYIKDVKVQ